MVEYGYAADGARLWKRIDQSATNVQVWIGDNYEEKGGKILYHVFAGGQQVCTFEPGSALYGGSDTNKVGYYYHEDNLNSSTALSDSAHNQIEVNAYYPFGRVQTASPQAGFKVSRQFTGQIKDDETGLYYFNARYFDPELGRFIQADTTIPDLSNPQSYNRFSYCVNDPLRYTDPSGHSLMDYLPFRSSYLELQGQNRLNEMVRAHTDYGDYHTFMAAKQNVPTAHDTATVAAIGHATAAAANAYITVEASIVAPEARVAAGETATAEKVEASTANGGRLGNQETREHVADVANKLEQHGWDITHGGGRGPEEYIPGPNGTKGSSYPDITAEKNGQTLRVNTIDTRANGVTPTTREANNAARIRSQKPDDTLILVPKPKQ